MVNFKQKQGKLLGLVADPVIEAIARLEFEDGLRTVVLPGGCWCPCGGCTYPRINFKPLGVRVGLGLGVVVIRTSFRVHELSSTMKD